MLRATIRIVLISCLAVMLTLFTGFFVRWVGGQQQFAPASHDWFSQEHWTVIAPSLEQLCQTPFAEQPKVIVMLPVERSRSEGWQINCSPKVAVETFLSQTKHRDWMLKLTVGELPDLDKLVDKVGAFDRDKRFAIYAPAQKVARDLRRKAPQWLFAADSSSLLRLHLFTGMYMETAFDFWPDFVVASNNHKDGSHLNAREVRELKRRNKRVLWNHLVSIESPEFPVDGVIQSAAP
jgi:hypothetical protein